MTEKTIPVYAYDGAMLSFNKTINKLWVLCILLITLLIASNIAWFVYEHQFEYTETITVDQESTTGYNNYIGNNGEINNGTPNNNDN